MRCFAAARRCRPTRRRFSSILICAACATRRPREASTIRDGFSARRESAHCISWTARRSRPPDVRAPLARGRGGPRGTHGIRQRRSEPTSDAALTLVDPELKSFRSLHGLPATGVPFTQVQSWQGRERECGPPPISVSRVSKRETDASISWMWAAAFPTRGSTPWSLDRGESRWAPPEASLA